MNKALKIFLFTAGSLLFWVGLWWALAAAFGKPLLLPTPLSVIKELGRLAVTSDFWQAVFTSLFRIVLGILLALVCGALLALLTVIFSRLCSTFLKQPPWHRSSF